MSLENEEATQRTAPRNAARYNQKHYDSEPGRETIVNMPQGQSIDLSRIERKKEEESKDEGEENIDSERRESSDS